MGKVEELLATSGKQLEGVPVPVEGGGAALPGSQGRPSMSGRTALWARPNAPLGRAALPQGSEPLPAADEPPWLAEGSSGGRASQPTPASGAVSTSCWELGRGLRLGVAELDAHLREEPLLLEAGVMAGLRSSAQLCRVALEHVQSTAGRGGQLHKHALPALRRQLSEHLRSQHGRRWRLAVALKRSGAAAERSGRRDGGEGDLEPSYGARPAAQSMSGRRNALMIATRTGTGQPKTGHRFETWLSASVLSLRSMQEDVRRPWSSASLLLPRTSSRRCRPK